jgi:DNA-binding NarL/FixJ family response regulator
VFTRHDDPEVVTLGKQIGAVDYIPKDAFADTALVETLRQMELGGCGDTATSTREA